METRHRAFSLGRVFAITTNTLTELTRQKVFYFLLIFALLLIGSSAFLARFTFQQEFQILKDVSLGAMSIFTSLLAIVATALLIPHDIEDRTAFHRLPTRDRVAMQTIGVARLADCLGDIERYRYGSASPLVDERRVPTRDLG